MARKAKNVEGGENRVEQYVEAFQAARAGDMETFEKLMGQDGLTAVRGLVNASADKGPILVADKPSDFDLDAEKPQAGSYVPTVRDAKTGAGYDIFSRLMASRVILLQGQVDEAMSQVACASLLFLSAEDKDAEINVYINSPGGSVIDGLAIINTMHFIPNKILTFGLGYQASMGSALLAAGDERRMTADSKLMIHSLGNGAQGKLADNEISIDAGRRLFEDLKANYIRHVGLTPEFWDLCCAKDTWFSAEQALKMGFIDGIVDANQNKEFKLKNGKTRKRAPYAAAAAAYQFQNAARRDADIAKMTTAEIKDKLQATSADGGAWERRRPELLTELSQRPEFWLAEQKAERGLSANDNASLSKRAAAKDGPSAA